MFTKYCEADADLRYQNVSINIGGKNVLCDVTGHVKSGEILGVFGGKGCGKTILLSALCGLTDTAEGEVLVGGVPVGSARGTVGFCLSEDLFLPTLTVEETLKYTAILRLSVDVPTSTKVARVREAMDLLELHQHANILVQFLPKVTKKRLAIACEMLTNPAVLLLDEPIMGLDFKDTLDLMKLLRLYVQKTSRILVIATSTCPGIVYQVCSRCLFLYNSQIAYSGTPADLVQFLQDVDLGYHSSSQQNPAEYILEQLCDETLNDTEPVQERIARAYRNRKCSQNGENGVTSNGIAEDMVESKNDDIINVSKCYKPNHHEVHISPYHGSKYSALSKSIAKTSHELFSTPYWHEFLVLLARNFHNARRRILFPVGVIQNVYILVICVLIWWRPDRNEDTVKDRLGLFFFTVVQWAFFSLLDAILTFPKEMKVVNRERRFGRYRLSAFCLSKTMSELPLAVLQPCVYLCVIYWVANLNGVHAFLSSLGVLFLDVLAAQSIGLFVGASLQPPWTISVVSLGLLSMMLWGGAFNTPPPWLQWGRFASFFFYGLNAFIYLELHDAPPIKCVAGSVYHTAPICNFRLNGTNTTIPEFPSHVLLEPLKVDWPLWAYVTVLAGIMVVTRLLWYTVLRMKKLN